MKMSNEMKRVLFVCVHNAGRSQMAEAFFNQTGWWKSHSRFSGNEAIIKSKPVVAEAMGEIGIDISRKKPRLLTLEMLESVDRVITMGCGAEGVCPASFVPTEDWQLEDPEGKPIERVRKIRDEVKTRVEGLIKELVSGEILHRFNITLRGVKDSPVFF